jgi:hypothetical protein
MAAVEFPNIRVLPVPDDVMDGFRRGNFAFPQMYGMHILRAGHAVVNQILDGDMTVAEFCDTQPDRTQQRELITAAETAHERVGADILHSQTGGWDETAEGIITPFSVQGVYMRTRKGILQAIHDFATTTLGLPEDAPYDEPGEHRFMSHYLLEQPEHRTQANLLQTIWRTADEVVQGNVINAAVGRLHTDLANLPSREHQNERDASIATAIRVARTSIRSVLIPGIEPLKPLAAEILQDRVMAEDAIDCFTLEVLYEGNDEFSDDDIARIRTQGRKC